MSLLALTGAGVLSGIGQGLANRRDRKRELEGERLRRIYEEKRLQQMHDNRMAEIGATEEGATERARLSREQSATQHAETVGLARDRLDIAKSQGEAADEFRLKQEEWRREDAKANRASRDLEAERALAQHEARMKQLSISGDQARIQLETARINGLRARMEFEAMIAGGADGVDSEAYATLAKEQAKTWGAADDNQRRAGLETNPVTWQKDENGRVIGPTVDDEGNTVYHVDNELMNQIVSETHKRNGVPPWLVPPATWEEIADYGEAKSAGVSETLQALGRLGYTLPKRVRPDVVKQLQLRKVRDGKLIDPSPLLVTASKDAIDKHNKNLPEDPTAEIENALDKIGDPSDEAIRRVLRQYLPWFRYDQEAFMPNLNPDDQAGAAGSSPRGLSGFERAL